MQLLFQSAENLGKDRGDVLVAEGFVIGPQLQREGHGFFALVDALAAVHIKEGDLAQQLAAVGGDAVLQRTHGDGFVTDQRQITGDGGELGQGNVLRRQVMQKILLGNTGIQVEGTGFGALPIQRRTLPEAVEILQAAYAGGIRFYDTARAYSDSEEKLGCAFRDVRKDIIIATKTGASTVEEMKRHLEETLRCLQTDYVDIYQLHNPSQVPDADSPLYRQLAAWKAQGVIRHIGLTNHSADNAIAAAQSGLYEVIQFPLSCISAPRDLEVIAACQAHGVGILAMKALAGGLITDASLFLRLPIPVSGGSPLGRAVPS